MNEKTMRYIGLGVGILLTLTIFYAGFYTNDWMVHSNSRFGIENTVVYGIFRNFGLNKDLSHILWYLCLFISFGLSWKYRFKTAKIINNINKLSIKIHKKV